jgi:hypothetical protein
LVESKVVIRVIIKVDATPLSGTAITGERLENFILVLVFVRLGVVYSFLGLAGRTREVDVLRIWRLYQLRQSRSIARFHIISDHSLCRASLQERKPAVLPAWQ